MSDAKSILVTGGAGFVGSRLIVELVKDPNNRVISLDNYFAGSKENHVEGAEYREGHTKDITTHVPERVDVVYHLGEYSRVAPSLKEPDVVWDLNMSGTHGVLEYWRQHKPKLIYAGSSTKFADERADGVEGKNRAPYSWSKAANTEYVHNYGRWYDLPYAIAYFYNVYGPGERAGQFDGAYGTVIETFKQHFLKGEPCTINGTGEQTRAFTHVDDTVSALIRIAEKGTRDEYGISAREVYSLLDVANMFGLEMVFREPTISTRSSGACDTSKLEALGWKQQHTLADYIATIKTKTLTHS
jgi:UDP-glucose 4-epimerase